MGTNHKYTDTFQVFFLGEKEENLRKEEEMELKKQSIR